MNTQLKRLKTRIYLVFSLALLSAGTLQGAVSLTDDFQSGSATPGTTVANWFESTVGGDYQDWDNAAGGFSGSMPTKHVAMGPNGWIYRTAGSTDPGTTVIHWSIDLGAEPAGGATAAVTIYADTAGTFVGAETVDIAGAGLSSLGTTTITKSGSQETFTGSVACSVPTGTPIWIKIACVFVNNAWVGIDNVNVWAGPTITVQPQPAKALAGGSATFSVAAIGFDPLEYQWRHAGTNLPGVVVATLTLNNVQFTEAGLYSVVVTDAGGSTPSADALLEVLGSGQLFGDNFDAFHDYGSGDVAGTIWDGVLNAANLDPGSDTTGGVLHLRNTGEGWENAPFYTGPFLYKLVAGNFNVEVQNIDNANVDYSDGGLMVRVPDVDDAGPGEDFMTLLRFNSVCCGEPIRVRSCDGGPLTHSGNFPAGQNFFRIERRGNIFKFFGKVNAGDAGALGYTLDRTDLAGLPVQVGLQHGTFSANAADRQFDNFWLQVLAGPTITTHPQATKALAGGSATFSVTATGIEPLEYQWRHAGTNLPGATEATLTLDNTQLTDAGLYSVIVTDADGSTESDEGLLEVLGSGQLFGDDFNAYHDYSSGDVTGTIWEGILNPQNLDPGSDTTGGVLHWRNTGEGWENANGSGPVLYKTVAGDFDAEVVMPSILNVQWSDGGIIARRPDASAGENYVTVKAFGPGSSVGARWAVNGAGNNASLGPLRPYVRLQRKGTTFKFYTKANAGDAWILGHTLDRPDMAGDVQVGLWHGTFVGNAADRQFDGFWLHLPVGPVITTQPLSQRVFAGDTASFSVTATGIEPLEYQWRHDGTNLPGATEAMLTLANVRLNDAGSYSVAVTDADGTAESDAATLTVLASMGVLTDDFNRYHDYTGGSVSGTIWDGVHNAANLDPGSDTTGGVLHWRNTGEGFEAPGHAGGPFLYRMVSGDFDAQVEVAAVEYVQWSDGGLMARVPNLDDAGPGEDYVTATLFSANNVDTWAQMDKIRSVDDDVTGNLWNSGVYGHTFLRLERLGNVFNFYTKAAAGDDWGLRETITRNDFPATLQVGLQHGTFVGNPADRQFDNFRLAGPNLVGAVSVSREEGQILLSWEGANLVLQRNRDLNNPAGWTDVADVTGNSATLPIGEGNEFFRLRTP